jgi:hypothetical protein
MAGKSSSRERKPVTLEDRPIRDPLGLHDRVVLHAETTQELLALIERCNAVRDAGKITQAQKLFRRVKKLNERLLELEDTGRRAPRVH